MEPPLEAHWSVTQKGRQHLNIPLQRKRGHSIEKVSVLGIAQLPKDHRGAIWLAVGSFFTKNIKIPIAMFTFSDQQHPFVSRGICSSLI